MRHQKRQANLMKFNQSKQVENRIANIRLTEIKWQSGLRISIHR